MNKKTSVFSKLYVGLILLFLYAPIAILIIFSFNKSKSRGTWSGFTLDWYEKLFSDSEMLASLGTTLLCGILAAVISTFIGVLSCLAFYSMKKRKKSLFISLAYIPMLNADIVTGISLMMMFTMLGMELGFLTLLLSHITFCVPYVILSIMPKINQLDYSHYEAALDLGATPSYALKKIVLPDLMPGIISGFLLSFTLSIDDFIISFLTTGNGVNNLSITIYTMAKRGINPEINAVSTFVFTAILMLLIAINFRPHIKTKKKEY